MSMTSTSTFPTMGDSGYEGLVNMSGDRSPYTKARPRQGATMDDTGGSPAGGRGSGMVHETMGPCFRPVASRTQAAPYPETGRGMRVVPSSIGNRDFWAARAANGTGYDV